MKLEQFITDWTEDPNGVKDVFLAIRETIESLDDVSVEFVARPGITYSLRGTKTSQDKRPVFVLADVIDDDPSARWLSVCFYGDTITDPDELGDLIPGGLLGHDGHCFDVEDSEAGEYVQARIREAHSNQ